MKMITVGSLFAGIGGFDLGLERAGMQVRWQVENDLYCIQVLEKHWPKVKRYGDIKHIKWAEIEPVDLICGGFPCQPVSVAGSQKGDKDDRWLWPEFLRAIREIRPKYALVENVPGLLSIDDGRLARGIHGELAENGYDAEWHIISAADVGAPHLRKRLFIIAYPNDERRGKEPKFFIWGNYPSVLGYDGVEKSLENSRCMVREERAKIEGELSRFFEEGNSCCEPLRPSEARKEANVANTNITGLEGQYAEEHQDGKSEEASRWGSQWAVEPDVGRVANGIPSRVDRLKCLGNAVVPQVAELIGRLIVQQEVEEVGD